MLEKELNSFTSLDGDELFFINGGSLPSSSFGGWIGIHPSSPGPFGGVSNPSGLPSLF